MILHDLIGIGIISVLGIGMLVVADMVKRIWDVPSEVSRKIAHVGCGGVLLVIPLVVTTHWSVLILSTSFAILMFATHALGLLRGVHGVGRGLGGVLVYPFAGWLAYWLSFTVTERGWVLYGSSIAVLAIADAAGALIGRSYGRHQYEVTDDHHRSLEGSAAVYVSAWLCVAVGVGISHTSSFTKLMLLSTAVAITATLLETVSVAGLDNLLVPFGTLFVLHHVLDMSAAELVLQLGLIAACAAGVIVLTYRRMSTVGGAVSIMLTGYLVWTTGGTQWIAPFAALAAVFALYERLTPMQTKHTRSRYAISTMITGLAVPVVVSTAAYLSTNPAQTHVLHTAFIASLGTTAAILLFMMPQHHSFRFKRLRRSLSTRHHWQYTPTAGKVALACVGAALPALIVRAADPAATMPVIASMVWGLAGCSLFVASASFWKCSHRMCPVCGSVDLLGMYCCQDEVMDESTSTNPHGICATQPKVATLPHGGTLSVPRYAVSFLENFMMANVAAAGAAAIGALWLGM